MIIVEEISKDIQPNGLRSFKTIFRSDDFETANKFFLSYQTDNELNLCNTWLADILAVKKAKP